MLVRDAPRIHKPTFRVITKNLVHQQLLRRRCLYLLDLVIFHNDSACQSFNSGGPTIWPQVPRRSHSSATQTCYGHCPCVSDVEGAKTYSEIDHVHFEPIRVLCYSENGQICSEGRLIRSRSSHVHMFFYIT